MTGAQTPSSPPQNTGSPVSIGRSDQQPCRLRLICICTYASYYQACQQASKLFLLVLLEVTV